MPSIGLPELVVIGMIVILVFGASRLPQLGEGLGRTVRNLKRSLQDDPRIGVQGTDGRPPTPAQQANTRPQNEPPRSSQPPDLEISDAELVSNEPPDRTS